jgi:hypothetical protein
MIISAKNAAFSRNEFVLNVPKTLNADMGRKIKDQQSTIENSTVINNSYLHQHQSKVE